VPTVKTQKTAATTEMAKKWSKLTGKDITTAAVMKKYNNLKTRTLKKSDINKTGNKKVVLEHWEKTLLSLLEADKNPSTVKTLVSTNECKKLILNIRNCQVS